MSHEQLTPEQQPLPKTPNVENINAMSQAVVLMFTNIIEDPANDKQWEKALSRVVRSVSDNLIAYNGNFSNVVLSIPTKEITHILDYKSLMGKSFESHASRLFSGEESPAMPSLTSLGWFQRTKSCFPDMYLEVLANSRSMQDVHSLRLVGKDVAYLSPNQE